MEFGRFQFSLISILAWTGSVALWSAAVPWVAKYRVGARHEPLVDYQETILAMLVMTSALAWLFRRRKRGMLMATLVTAAIAWLTAAVMAS